MTSLAILGCRGIPARYGGFESFAEQLSVRLVEAGVDVHVYCEKRDADAETDVFKGVSIKRISSPSIGPLSSLVYDLKCLWQARRAYDVVYMLGYSSAIFVWIPRLFGSIVWVNMDGMEWKRSKWSIIGKAWLRIMESVAVRSADLIVCDSRSIQTYLRDRHIRASQSVFIPYGASFYDEVGCSSSEFCGAPENSDYYLVVCRLEPENHVEEIVSAFVRSASKSSLLIVGDFGASRRYETRVRLIANDHVKFMGSIYDEHRLARLRSNCRAYIHGHSVGGTNPSLLESMVFGRPIIAHDNEFNREVLESGGAYFSDSKELSERISELESEASLKWEYEKPQVAKARVQKHYSWEQVANSYLACLADTERRDAVNHGRV